MLHETEELIERALLVAVDCGEYDAEESMDELEELARTAGAVVKGKIIQKLKNPVNATYVGEGKLQEIYDYCQMYDIDIIILDDELTGVQLRNIQKVVDIKVIDRTMLILDIFASRALSSEGKIQVELAQQKYRLSRLVGLGANLSKQQGGIGSRGSGESKLEYDRRHIRKRIDILQDELKEMVVRRDRIRERRKKNETISIAIVGYTNVGKSTLLNYLTDAGVLAEDMLFATLDPTARAITLTDGRTALMIDTVGLLRRLPHQLINAFRSTLEEASNSDLIVHLCDISNEHVDLQIETTKELLNELGCEEIPILTVFNKIDKVEKLTVLPSGDDVVCISAGKGQGIDTLLQKITDKLSETISNLTLLIPYDKGHLIDFIMKNGKINSQDYENEGTKVSVIIENRFVHMVEEYII